MAEISPGVLAVRSARSFESWLLLYFLRGGEVTLSGHPLRSANHAWQLEFSSNDAAYGGAGAAAFDAETQTLRATGPETLLLKEGSPV